MYSGPRLNRDLITAIVSSGAVILFFFSFFLQNPNDFTFAPSGDGLKNYYTFSYFVEHDKNFHFSGMNYPHGEFAVYTDNHPLLAEILSFVHRHVYDLSGSTVGILNVLCLFAFMITVVIFLLIFYEYKIYGLWAIAGSLLITFLTPQSNRLLAHYSLSFSFMFPLIWLLVLKLVKRDKKVLLASILSLVMIAEGLIHTYHLFISLIFIAGFVFVGMLRKDRDVKSNAHLAAAMVFSAVVFFSFIKINDRITDRPQHPTGMATYTTSIAGTTLPYKTKMADFFQEKTNQINRKAESHGYVGMVVMLIVLMLIARYFVLFQKKDERPTIPSSLHISLIAAMLAWFFGTNWINEFTGDLLYKILPPLRQFRGLGRLSWILYYVVSFYVVYRTHLYFTLKKKARWQFVILFSLAALWTTDVYFSIQGVTDRMDHRNKQLNRNRNTLYHLIEKENINVAEFQAILCLPFYHVGNEKISIERGGFSIGFAMGLSYTTGLPMINSMMSRTSISESFTQFQLLKTEPILKERLMLFDDRPILLLRGSEPLSDDEKRIIEKAELLASGTPFQLYRLSPDSLNTVAAAVRSDTLLTQFIASKITDSNSKNSDPFFSYQHFDEAKSDIGLASSGSFLVEEGNPLFEYTLQPTRPKTKIHLSFWFYVDPAIEGMPKLTYKITNTEGKETYSYDIKYAKNPLTFGSWIYLKYEFESIHSPMTYRMISDQYPIRIDELLIRSADNNVLYKNPESGVIFRNNIPVDRVQ